MISDYKLVFGVDGALKLLSFIVQVEETVEQTTEETPAAGISIYIYIL